MADRIKTLAGPLALTNTLTTNIYQGGGASVLIRDIVTQIHFCNYSGGALLVSVWVDASGGNSAGKQLISHRVPANDVWDWYGKLELTSTLYLVGGAAAATSVDITVMGMQQVV